MSKSYAKIESGVVTEISVYNTDPGSPWVVSSDECPEGSANTWDTVFIGATYDSSQSGAAAFTPAPPTSDENYDKAIKLLNESDWTQLADIGLTTDNVIVWRTYRAALRVIAKSPTAGNLTWPTKPDEEYV